MIGILINVSPHHTVEDLDRLTKAIDTATRSSDKVAEFSTNHTAAFSLRALAEEMKLEASGIHFCKAGESILHDFDLAVPAQHSFIENGVNQTVQESQEEDTTPEVISKEDAAILVSTSLNYEDILLLGSILSMSDQFNNDE